jgi:hypothetical protein
MVDGLRPAANALTAQLLQPIQTQDFLPQVHLLLILRLSDITTCNQPGSRQMLPILQGQLLDPGVQNGGGAADQNILRRISWSRSSNLKRKGI